MSMFEALEARRLLSTVAQLTDAAAAVKGGSSAIKAGSKSAFIFADGTRSTQSGSGKLKIDASKYSNDNLIINEDHGTVEIENLMTGQEMTYTGIKKIEINEGKLQNVILYHGSTIAAKITGHHGADIVTTVDEGKAQSHVKDDKDNDIIRQGAPPTGAMIAGTGDFNHDGKVDLLWHNDITGQNFIWLMDGITMKQIVTLPGNTDHRWRVCGVGDFNGDGEQDIVFRRHSTGTNAVWFMQGTTVTGNALLPSAPKSTWRMCGTADFNGDSKPDILWRNIATGDDAIWIMDGLSTSTVVPVASLPNPCWQMQAIGDVNGDGHSDILLHNTATRQNMVWLLDGSNFQAPELMPLPTTPLAVWQMGGTGDFNSDGHIDIVWHNRMNGRNAVWLMDGTDVIATPELDQVL
jgi:hypothetical protein